jgi:hypothetical protein
MSFDIDARSARLIKLQDLNDQGEVVCPFCGEDGFDWIGLKIHLQQWCVCYNELIMEDEK